MVQIISLLFITIGPYTTQLISVTTVMIYYSSQGLCELICCLQQQESSSPLSK